MLKLNSSKDLSSLRYLIILFGPDVFSWKIGSLILKSGLNYSCNDVNLVVFKQWEKGWVDNKFDLKWKTLALYLTGLSVL